MESRLGSPASGGAVGGGGGASGASLTAASASVAGPHARRCRCLWTLTRMAVECLRYDRQKGSQG